MKEGDKVCHHSSTVISNIQMMLFIATVTFLLHLSVCNAGDPCPPKPILAPCTCAQVSLENGTLQKPALSTTSLATVNTPEPGTMQDTGFAPPVDVAENDIYYYTVVDCKVSKTLTALEETVSYALNRKLVDKLIVANVPPQQEHALARLPSGWLKRVRVRQFEVSNSKMSGDFIWQGNPFEGQDRSLLWFAAKRCSLSGSLTFDTIGTTNTKGLNSLPRVQIVDFSHNYLTSIMAVSFRVPPTNLTAVILSYNSIQFVEGGSFQYITQLKKVDLSHNLLESVVRSIFPSPAAALEHIDLSWNSLNALPLDFFTNMPALKIVNISNNFLYAMPEKPWATVWSHLTSVDVTGNFVECNCDLMWLLPILSPPEVNVTTTPSPSPLPGQTVKGTCSRIIGPFLFVMKYELVTLTRDRLSC